MFFQQDLDNFAVELLQHGIISPLTVRQMPSGRFELVAGERRLRAARIAMLQELPVVIKRLSDEEVMEIQLAENIQRENPHRMHEAQAIGQLLKTRKSIDEVAGRLGKSRQFVYGRIKLLSLIEPFQEMFLADAITLTQAVEIASISTNSQKDFLWRTVRTGRCKKILNCIIFLHAFISVGSKKVLFDLGTLIFTSSNRNSI